MTGIRSERIETLDIGLDHMPAPTRQVFEATGDEASARNPVPSMYRWWQLSEAHHTAVPTIITRGGVFPNPDYDSAQVLTPQQANERFGIKGELTFANNVSILEAQLMNSWKREELQRASVLRRAQGGFGEGAGRLAINLMITAMDPVNVASAFIPVVGEVRYAAMVAKFGRPLAATAKGAAESFIGAAVSEVPIYLQARNEQANYGLMDSLVNIGFGTALGGGLHLGAGWLKSRLDGEHMPPLSAVAEAAGPQVREAGMRGSVAAVLEGRPVRVGELFAAAQKGLANQAAALERQISELTGRNVGGWLDDTIRNLRLELEPVRLAERLTQTAQVMERNNTGGRFNKQIAEARAAADSLAHKITAEPDRVRGGLEAERSGELTRARETLAAQEESLRRLMEVEQPEIAARLREAKKRGDLSEVDIRAERARVRREIATSQADVTAQRAKVAGLADATDPVTLNAADVLDRLGRVDRINAAVKQEAAAQQNSPTFMGDDVAPGEAIQVLTAKSVKATTAAQDIADVAELEKQIATMEQMAKSAGAKIPQTLNEPLAIGEGDAKAFEQAAFCLGRAA